MNTFRTDDTQTTDDRRNTSISGVRPLVRSAKNADIVDKYCPSVRYDTALCQNG